MFSNNFKLTFTVLLLLCSILMTGCVAVVANGGALAAKGLPRAQLEEKADAGDVQAQYELGLSNCCMGIGFDTQVATEWLCKAAHADHSGAMFELGRIYLGDVSRTPAPGQKILKLATEKENIPYAYMWLSLATQQGHEKAAKKLNNLAKEINDDREAADSLLEDWKTVPCEYSEVFPV